LLKGSVGEISFEEDETGFDYPLVVLNREYDDMLDSTSQFLEENPSVIHGYYFKHTVGLNFRFVSAQNIKRS
jgi:hypothetical protein